MKQQTIAVMVAVGLTGGIIMIGVGIGMFLVEGYEEPAQVLPTYMLPPCPTEDSDNCYWDATRMGNRAGISFITLNGVTYYPEA